MIISDSSSTLDRLNTTERNLLALLGRGHTAKSIARLRSVSEAAVNERFRSARRKTGIGSSREIARLVVAQDNRDDFIGLANLDRDSLKLAPFDAPRTRRASPFDRWRLPMVVAGLTAIAILAQQAAAPSAASAPNAQATPPAVAALFTPQAASPDLGELHARVAAGQRDPVWSAATEEALSRAYHRASSASDALDWLRVSCTASLCEVLGAGRPGSPPEKVQALMAAGQSPTVQDTATDLDLDQVVASFKPAPGPGTAVFVAYWRRGGGV
jgi:DNA-binding CsgD family transcriptional regulator